MFAVNDKVVCVRSTMTPGEAKGFSQRLVEGRIYCVRGIDPGEEPSDPVGLYLVGITGDIGETGVEDSFNERRFRKVGSKANSS